LESKLCRWKCYILNFLLNEKKIQVNLRRSVPLNVTVAFNIDGIRCWHAAWLKSTQSAVPLCGPVDAAWLWKSVVTDRTHRPQGDISHICFHQLHCLWPKVRRADGLSGWAVVCQFFTARCIYIAHTMQWQDVCPSVCLSVTYCHILSLSSYTYPYPQSFFTVG